MAAEEKWYFTKEQLANTPSRKCGYDVDKELSYRQQAANFIQDMGQRLKVTQLCINTAIVYMHRFYVFHSFTQFPWNSMATASLFLAAKVEEQPRKLEHVIKVAHVCLHREAQLDIKSDQYLELAQDLVFNENVLLQTLGFDVAIDHPHTHVVRCCHLIRASKDLAQTSYFMASNSLHLTTMCVQYKPTVVACFCIHLACKWSNWEIPQSSEGKDWFWYVDKTVSLEQLERLTAEFLVIYDKCPSKLRRKIRSASSHESQEPRATAIPEPNQVDNTFKLLESDAKFNSLPDGPKFDIPPHLDQKQAGGTSSDKSSQSTPAQPQIARPHGDPSTSRVDYREYREKKERLEREKHAMMSNKAPPNSKHTTNMRHPPHQYHPTKAPPVGGQHSNQMNQTRRDASFPRDPNKSRESQNNPMFPPAIRHDPANVTSSHSSTTTTITPTSSTSSNAITEPIEEDKARIKPLLKEHQSGQRPPDPFNHKYQNAEHRHRREHYPPDGHHKAGDPSKFHVKPRPSHPGMDIKKEKEEDQSKRPSIQQQNINNSKQAPPRNPLAPSNMSRTSKPRSSNRNGTSESVPLLPSNHSTHASTTIASTTSSITTTSTTTTLSSSSSHSIIPEAPDLTNPSAISHLLHQTPPQQVRLTRESPYPSRTKSSMPHPPVPNRPRTSTPLSPLNSPPTPGKSSRTNRNRTNSSSSEELIPVVKKLDEIPGYENILRDSKLGSGGIKLPGRVPEMIQPIRDRRKEEISHNQLLPPPPPSQTHAQSVHLSNVRIKDENIRIKEENVRIKEEIRIKEERPITPTTETITSPTFTLSGPIKLEKVEPHEIPTSDALNRVSSSSSLDQSIIDVVSLPEPVEKMVSPPLNDAARLIADSTPIQEDAARSKKAAKHHKSDKKKRKEKSKDKDKEKERDKDKEKKKKKHKEKDKEREKTKDIPSSSAPIKIKIPKDKLNLQPSAEQTSDSSSNNNSSGLKIKIPKDRLVNSETPTTSVPTPASTSSTTTSTSSQGGGLKIKISKDVYENFNKEPRKRTLNETNVTNSNTPTSGPPPAKTPRLADSKHRSSTSSGSMYGKQNGQPAVCGYNKMAQKMAESINNQNKGKNSTSSQP